MLHRPLALAVALAVAIFFRMGYGKVDYIFTIDSVYYTVFAEAADNLHFNHSAQILN